MYRSARHTTCLALLLALVIGAVPAARAQVTDGQLQAMRDDPKGDIIYKKKGIMDGNLVRTLYFNQGEVAEWPNQPSGEWPRGTGHSYLDGVAVLVGGQFTGPNGQLIQSVATAYREWMDQDPVTGDLWGFAPVPGYTSVGSEIPALSNQPDSWPATWPTALALTPEWNSYWYGYFGRGVFNADLETFFVMDDATDAEFSLPPFSYYPLSADHDRLGMGLRVEVRGFQWSQVLAEDNIFWHYDIVNLSDGDYDQMAFGFYTDTGIGGTNDSQDDRAFFDVDLDIAYGFDGDNIGTPAAWQPVGYMGYAYLESPGNPFNGIDDDGDGLVDERRDDGIDNDGDWVPYSDVNGNGEWDDDEPLNDDVGRDGVGPLDRQYNGPDEGEGDGMPTPGEPHFDATDIDESDMIGLQSLSIYRLCDGGCGDGWPRADAGMWAKMTSHLFDTELQRANISMVFGSGPFELRQGRRERFSMALLFGSDLDDLVFNKQTVQEIYNANYNFARPPSKALLTAVPGDGKVVLYWDALSESSRDPFLGYKYDFEGYLVYRSTEAEFNDIKVITDAKGEPKYWKPVAQFDLKDGIVGPDPVGINGAHFWRGDDTGLQHSFVDTTVTNGVRYYYAVVAYDQGDPEFGTTGLPPSETTKIIREDFSGNVLFTDINTAVVTPNAPVAGYVSPEVEGDLTRANEGVGTGQIGVQVLDPQRITDGASYRVRFHAEGDMPGYETASFDVLRVEQDGSEKMLVPGVDADLGAGEVSPPFDGMVVSVQNDTLVTVDQDETGWLVQHGDLSLGVSPHTRVASRAQPWPANYEVTFHDQDVYTTPFFGIQLPITVTNTTDGYPVDVEVLDSEGRKGSIDNGDPITIIEYLPSGQFRLAWDINYSPPLAGRFQNGDRFQIHTTKAFREGDTFVFSTKAARVDDDAAKSQMDGIAVVPNPYVAAAVWERRTLNQSGRGERRIDFIHLPQRCTIRIYTLTGALVETIDHDAPFLDGTEAWNLISADGTEVSYGVYVYHVDAPGVGEHVGKFAIVK